MKLQRPFDPVVTFRNSQGEAARGTLTSLQRRSLVMEIYNPYSIVQVSEVLHDLAIRSGDHLVYKGDAVVVSLLNTGLMMVASVTLVNEWNDLSELGAQTQTVGEAVNTFIQEWRSRTRIRYSYQIVVGDMRAYFSEVTRWLDQFDLTPSLPRDDTGRVTDEVFYEIALPLLEKGREYLIRFETEAAQVGPEEESAHRAFAQALMHPLVLRAPFVYRTFAKPLGYAGDYMMVDQILGNPREGPSTYFELVNFMFLQAGVAQAHRNRVAMLQERIAERLSLSRVQGKRFRLLNVGCGPAAELQRLAAQTASAEGIEIVLMDFSEETLQYAKQQIDKASLENSHPVLKIELRHESVHQLLKRSVRELPLEPDEQFDMIYCAGLFDYLADKACTRLIAYFNRYLKPGGTLLVTNVHKNNPERFWMEHFMEWYLIYRNEADLESMFPTELPNVVTYTDSTRINLFAEAMKPA